MTELLTDLARTLILQGEWAALGYFLVVNSFYAVLLLAAAWEMREHVLKTKGESLRRVLSSEIAPSISMLAPAYNEAATIVESVQALLAIEDPKLEVVVVNDGSSDGTMSILLDKFDLSPIHPVYDQLVPTEPIARLYRSPTYPHLVVADKANGGGKADALNAALNLATGDLVCAIDADTLIEPDALQRMARPFLMEEKVVAAGGTIRLVNDCEVRDGRVVTARVPREALPGFQVMEYLRAFLFGRLGWNLLGGNLIVSGAFGLFRRDAVIGVGGYANDTVGEDVELILKLRSRSYETNQPGQVAFIPDPVAWTLGPETLASLANQRSRWHRGLADVLWRYRHVMWNPRYKMLGMVVFPYFFFVELIAPILEAIGLLMLLVGLIFGITDVSFVIFLFLATYGYGMALTFLTLAMDEVIYHRYHSIGDRLFLISWAILENFGYRQLTVLWRIQGLVAYFRGQTGWGNMERKSFTAAAPRTGE